MLLSNTFSNSLKNLAKIIICFCLFYTPLFVNAGAAEKWEYEPVMKNMNIEVKAHKVDQYGAAVNDYEYNTKIDPKTDANRTKMGKVGFGRLLKSTGWGLLGSAALEALLQSVDWIMDPASQSIWRNKKPDPNGSLNCGGGFIFRFQTGEFKSCPIDAIQPVIQSWSNSSVTYKFVKFDSDPFDPVNSRPTFTVSKTTSSETTYIPNQNLERKPDPNAQPEPKEYLTPEALADYANHTHPDYANPELAPKLEPKYSPKIAEDLWKPSNDWEKENSPTVNEVERKLDEAQPEPKKEPELTPNPETGGMTLPSFCSWAAPVCEFIKWVKEPSEKDNDNNEVDIEDIPIPQNGVTVSIGNNTCPSFPVNIHTPFNTIQSDLSPVYLCQIANGMKTFFIALGFFTASLIVGRRN